jgi:hypothetical protein
MTVLQAQYEKAGSGSPAADSVGSTGAQLAPAEDPQPDEHRFHEEREQALHRERRAEYVADEPGVGRPVHSELEFLHNSRDYANSKVDQEKLTEELRHPQVGGVLLDEPRCLHTRDQDHQTDGQRDEQEVVHGGNAELSP